MTDKITDKELDDAAKVLLGDEETKDDKIDVEDDKEKKDEKEIKADDIDFDDLITKKVRQFTSNLGQKFTDSEKRIEDLTAMVESLVNVIQKDQDTYQEGTPLPPTVEELENVVLNIVNKQNQTVQQRDREYEGKYLEKFGNLTSELDPKVSRVVENVMRKEFNVRYSDDPMADAERNFLKTKLFLMEQAAGRKKNPLKGAEDGIYLGGPTESENDFRQGSVIQLDSFAKDFIEKTGMKEEDVKKALVGDAPSYIAGPFAQHGKKA